MSDKQIVVILIYACGMHSFGFAVFHIYFWKLFDWKNDLKKLNVANRAIIQIANLRLIYFFLFVATVCFVFPLELTSTPFGKFFLLGISLFWLGRTIEQFIFFKIKHKLVNLLTALFVLGALLFASPVLYKFFLYTMPIKVKD